jgi:hypothetical protein
VIDIASAQLTGRFKNGRFCNKIASAAVVPKAVVKTPRQTHSGFDRDLTQARPQPGSLPVTQEVRMHHLLGCLDQGAGSEAV